MIPGQRLTLCGLASLLALTGACHRVEGPRRPAPALRLERDVVGSASPAPSTDVLPAAEAIEIVRQPDPRAEYTPLDDAFFMGEAFGDAPPDYAVVVDATPIWIWRSLGDSMLVAEPVNDSYRLYYFDPRATLPFLIRDGDRAYGFDGPRLAEVYDPDGRVQDRAETMQRSEEAGRLMERAEVLRASALHRPIESIPAANWAAALPLLIAMRSDWTDDRRQQMAWRTLDTAYEARQATYWKPEKERRQRSAERFDSWSARGFRGSAPAAVEGADRQSERLAKAGLAAPAEAEAR